MAIHSSVYDTPAIRILSAAHYAAMHEVKHCATRPLNEDETGKISKRITDNLMRVFDLGERDASALNRAALEGLSASPQSSGLFVVASDANSDREPPLTEYKLYVLDARNSVSRPAEIVDAVSDEAAIKTATKLLDGHAIELWKGDRLIVHLKPNAVPLAASNYSTTKGDAKDGSANIS